MDRETYLATLKKRARDSRIHKKYQLDGLEIAEILGDEKHKSLYIKLAKNGDASELRRLAKTVAEQENVRNRGALFMYLLKRPTKTGKTKRRKRSHGKRNTDH